MHYGGDDRSSGQKEEEGGVGRGDAVVGNFDDRRNDYLEGMESDFLID